MISCFHEYTPTTLAPRSHPEAFGGPGRPDSRSLDRNKDRSTPPGLGRSETRLDNGSLGTDPHELKSLDSRSKRNWFESFRTKTTTWTAGSFNSKGASGTNRAPGTVARPIWPSKNSMGWANACDSPEAALRNLSEGPSSPDVDAPVGISIETRRARLSPGQEIPGPSIREGFKKNSRIWDLVKQSFFKTRPDLRFIPSLAGAGQRKAFV